MNSGCCTVEFIVPVEASLLLPEGPPEVAERLACSPPTKANRVQSPAGSLRIFARGNRAGRCHWSAGFLGDLPFPPPFHYGAAPYSPHFALIGSEDLDVKSRPNLFIHPLSLYACTRHAARRPFVSQCFHAAASQCRAANFPFTISVPLQGFNILYAFPTVFFPYWMSCMNEDATPFYRTNEDSGTLRQNVYDWSVNISQPSQELLGTRPTNFMCGCSDDLVVSCSERSRHCCKRQTSRAPFQQSCTVAGLSHPGSHDLHCRECTSQHASLDSRARLPWSGPFLRRPSTWRLKYVAKCSKHTFFYETIKRASGVLTYKNNTHFRRGQLSVFKTSR
ncbi:hypothetical protein PR048_012144 [Dryococelus australis]|uniref:Uncharacterized protein n=1 Tax=Dryococelus australis TaxID=614101 RepID=A0ABQ9HPT8_9NEOP|nr:hypothetical protein PR048_012144 [Dryococelus australis]